MEIPGTAAVAVVIDVVQDTSSVKLFTLQLLPSQQLRFKPGQWVDFYAPRVAAVGGYSIISTPQQLAAHGTIELAVKRSSHRMATWLHTECRVGDKVHVAVGGKFFLTESQARKPLLMAAGGIGITPLISMIASAAEAQSSSEEHPASSITQEMPPGTACVLPASQTGADSSAAAARPRIHLMFSASSPEEFPLLHRVLELQARHPDVITVDLFSTQATWPVEAAGLERCNKHAGRITPDHLAMAIKQLRQGYDASHQQHGDGDGGGDDAAQAFACGPPGFAEFITSQAVACGLPEAWVHAEKWW